MDAAVNRLSTALSALTTSHAKNAEVLTATADEQTRLEAEEADLRRQVEQTETKRAWFQGFRDRVETVAEFLDEKVRVHNEVYNVMLNSCIVPRSRKIGGGTCIPAN